MSEERKSDVQQLQGILAQFNPQTVAAAVGSMPRPCGGGGGRSAAVPATDALLSTISIERTTTNGVFEDRGPARSRGQDAKVCPTDPLALFLNFTAAAVNVAGDLKIDPASCPVVFVFGPGVNETLVFRPGLDAGIVIAVAAGMALTGYCAKSDDAKICKWSFTRTSP